MGDFVEMKVTFPNEEGTKLAGVLVEPKTYPAGPKRVVVMLHGLYQHKNISMLKPFGERIPADTEVGLATFRFDCRGLKESEGVTSSLWPNSSQAAKFEPIVIFESMII